MAGGMNQEVCPGCGTQLEADMAFCPGCGRPRGPQQYPAPPVPMPWGPPGPSPTFPENTMMPMAYLRPVRNPKQVAAVAAGVMTLIAGIFALIWGTAILTFDVFHNVRGAGGMTMDPIPFMSGIAFVIAYVASCISTYYSFRLTSF